VPNSEKFRVSSFGFRVNNPKLETRNFLFLPAERFFDAFNDRGAADGRGQRPAFGNVRQEDHRHFVFRFVAPRDVLGRVAGVARVSAELSKT